MSTLPSSLAFGEGHEMNLGSLRASGLTEWKLKELGFL